MKLTLNIIVDFIGREHVLSNISKTFGTTNVPWLTTAAFANTQTLDENWLHLFTEDDAPAFLATGHKAASLCFCKHAHIPAALKEHEDHVVFIHTDTPPEEMYKSLRTYFVKVERWVSRMRQVYLEEGDYQAYLDASEDILDNFITITDSSFQLLAHTKGKTIDDPLTERLLELGYHPPETVKQFTNQNVMGAWLASTEPLEVIEKSPVTDLPCIAHVFKFRQSYFVHMVMLCNERPVTAGLLDLTMMLVEALELHVGRIWATRKGFSQPHDELFLNLLANKRMAPEALRDKASILGIPHEANFLLCIIDLADKDSIRCENFAWKLVEQLHTFKVSIYKNKILVLGIGNEGEEPPSFGFLRYSFLANFSARIGESSAFTRLEDLEFAYSQALVALRYGGLEGHTLYSSYDPNAGKDPSVVVYHRFNDAFANYLLYSAEHDERLLGYCVTHHPLMQMYKEDTGGKSSNVEILLTYLSCDRKATLTASRLHMHRNNVIYHIDQIRNKYNINLDDPSTRFEILLFSRIIKLGKEEPLLATP